MSERKRVTDSTQAEVLVRSRRRCCVCFGLSRDENEKKGQIAHLDGDPSNNDESNLAFLCFDHHDQYDSKTRQSKNLTKSEVVRYRTELYERFSLWAQSPLSSQLLSYLAASVTDEDIANTLIKVGYRVTAFPELQITWALTEREIDLIDGDLAMPLHFILDNLAAWGFLTYEFDEPNEKDEHFRFRIHQADPLACKRIAAIVSKLDPDRSSRAKLST